MKKLYIALLLISCLIYTGCTSKPQSPTTVNSIGETTIYTLGDSITAGYQLPLEQGRPAKLEALLHSNGYTRYKVVNAGKSGDTSQQLKDRLTWSISDAKKGDIAIVTIGGNDGFQSVPVATLKNNLRDIIIELQTKGLTVIIGGMQITTNLGKSYISEFKEIYPSLAKETNASLIPFILDGVALNPSLNLADMIHPNEAGYAIIANTVYNHLLDNKLITQ